MGKSKKPVSYDEVELWLYSNECIILTSMEDYTGSRQSVKYQCKCGEISYVPVKGNCRNNRSVRCKKCSTKEREDKIRSTHDGKAQFQTDEFREKYRETSIKHYGVDSPLKNKEVLDRVKQTRIERYGYDIHPNFKPENQKIVLMDRYGVDSIHKVPTFRKKFEETIMKKYGVPNLAYLSRPASKQSQQLFQEIFDLLDETRQHHVHFAELNAEYVRGNKEVGYFKYDFVDSATKRVIEFNGWNFHPRPDQCEDETGQHAFNKMLSVKVAREYEKQKFDLLVGYGFDFLVVWDRELVNRSEVIKKCLTFLMEE